MRPSRRDAEARRGARQGGGVTACGVPFRDAGGKSGRRWRTLRGWVWSRTRCDGNKAVICERSDATRRAPGRAAGGNPRPRPSTTESMFCFRKSYVDGPRLQGVRGSFWRPGRVQSYVRPVRAAHMAAGPDGVRGSGPYQNCALLDARCALIYSGLPNPRLDRFAITCLFTLAILRTLRPIQAACPTISLAR